VAIAVLLPDTDQAVACAVAERIRSDIAAFFRAYPVSGLLAPTTVSIRVATCCAGSPAAPALIAAADRALCAAKRRGRDRIAADPQRGNPEITEAPEGPVCERTSCSGVDCPR
jgi:PleD family two-component response regulator